MNKQRLILAIPLIIFGLLSILFWKGLSNNPTELPSALIGKPVPEFNLRVLPAIENPAGMERATNKDLLGKVGLLNIWATWCVTCKIEHPFLNKLKQQGVLIYGINYKDDLVLAQQWVEELHNPYVYSVLDEEGTLAVDLGVYGYPETFVFDKKGIIRYRHAGDVNETVWRDIIQPLMLQLERE